MDRKVPRQKIIFFFVIPTITDGGSTTGSPVVWWTVDGIKNCTSGCKNKNNSHNCELFVGIRSWFGWAFSDSPAWFSKVLDTNLPMVVCYPFQCCVDSSFACQVLGLLRHKKFLTFTLLYYMVVLQNALWISWMCIRFDSDVMLTSQNIPHWIVGSPEKTWHPCEETFGPHSEAKNIPMQKDWMLRNFAFWSWTSSFIVWCQG